MDDEIKIPTCCGGSGCYLCAAEAVDVGKFDRDHRPCVDCGGRPEIVLIQQDVNKCVSCFVRAAMNAPCFRCKVKPTEVVVRAIAIDGRNDAVGVCMLCLMAHIAGQKN